MLTAAQMLGQDGPFVSNVPGFQPRAPQLEMAEAVQQSLETESVLVVEAGTGTGKTYAYLVPAILSGKKVIVSTGTRNLQDQLFHRDLPEVCRALGIPVRVALLKGRANYLCQYRLDVTLMEGRLKSRQQVDYLQRIRAWAGHTRSGDIAEVADVPEEAMVWPLVTSNAENCLGTECPSYSECFVVQSRRAAQEADLLVINHHLLFADMALKEEGFGELLPGANAFILDEAHTLPDIASNFFGIALSGRQLQELTRDTRAEHLRDAGDMRDIPAVCDQLDKAVMDFRLSLNQDSGRVSWQRFQVVRKVQAALEEVMTQLTALGEWLEEAAVRGKGLDNCWQRCMEFLGRLHLLMNPPADAYIQWLEIHKKSFTFFLTPLDIAEGFSSRMRAYPSSWVFTSATLAIGDSFSHFCERLGIQEYQSRRLDSPFDYAKNALLVTPDHMPEPNSERYTRAVAEYALPLIEASRGRAFLLFTSYRAMHEARDYLQGKFPYPLLTQGDAPRDVLLDTFRQAGNAVLLGTSSFWEGVDVRGQALSLVIIDKLPFASPGDPVLQARIELIRKAGGNPFMDFQLPNAVIALKQGVGRLIRDVQDKGVMVICDPRLVTKPYGRTFLKSMPPMQREHDLQQVRAFLESI